MSLSGDCQVNVNCSEGSSWQKEKNAVALILVDGVRWCTGSLINTTCNDDRPLLLTADHCLNGHDAISNPSMNNWSFYWNYEEPNCTSEGAAPILSTTGAIVVANNNSSDFALLSLTEDPKHKNGVTPYYLGWDRSSSAGSGGVIIHHPRGDVKKIATYTGTPINSFCMNNNYWQTGVIATTNGHSLLLPGSSGSPLINSSKKVIGQLLGPGNPTLCPEYNCENTGPQQISYGKFDISWNGNGHTDNRRRLDNWLNPSGGTAPTTLNGKEVTMINGPSLICTSASYTATNLPSGATVTSWNISPSGAATVSGSGLTRTITKTGSFNGQIRITLSISSACGSSTSATKYAWIGAPIVNSVTGPQQLPVGGSADYYMNVSYLGSTPTYSWSTAPISLPISSSGLNATITFPNTDADYQVKGKATNTCGSSTDRILHVSTGANDPWIIYPNPADESLLVSIKDTRLQENSMNFSAIIYDQFGRELRQSRSRDGRIEFDTRNLSNGTYFLHIFHNGKIQKEQVLIQHKNNFSVQEN